MSLRRRSRRQGSPAYLIVGEDSYLRSRLREQIVAAAVPPEARGMAVAKFSLEETPLGEVLGRAATAPLFSPSQVLVLSDVEALGEKELDQLEKYLEAPPESTVLVFEVGRLDRRTRAARLLLEVCELMAAESPDDSAAVRALQRWADERGLKLEPEAAEELVFAVGSDQGRLRSELAKLHAYVGDRGEVSRQDVAALVTPARQFSVFDLAGLLAERRRADVLVRLRRLLEAGESPVGIVGLLAWLYRQLLQAQALPPSAPTWKAAQSLRAPRSRVEQLLRQARRFSPQELRTAFAALQDADVALKSSPPDPTAVLEALVAQLTPPSEVREPRSR
ncbi:MAG: DNA polymerase III subunit delta [Terriglobia bacterium]